jgi:galactose mutarotase-like enzyme
VSGYSIRRSELEGIPVIALVSEAFELASTFAPGAGMVGCSLLHAGEELLGTRDGLASYVAKRNTMGIPLLHPWANRLDGFAYSVNGHRVEIDPESPAIRLEANGLPMHGLLAASKYWTDVHADAGADGATLTARLDFAAHEDLMTVFPFAHELTMQIRLFEATLTVATTLTATGDRAVPVSFGFHPYFKLPGVPAGEWVVEMPVKRHVVVDERMIPTGQFEPVEVLAAPLGARTYDDGFDRLADPPVFSIAAGGRKIAVEFEAGYPVAVVWHPEDGDFICFEPMTARTNALGSGDPDLRLVQPGGSFTASWAISVS